MISEYRVKINKFFVIAYILLAAGTILGSFYYVNCSSEIGDIKNTLKIYVDSVKNGLEVQSIIINTLKTNLGLLAMLVVCAFFRVGILFAAFLILRSGFITGFTAASIIGVYGYKGLLIMLLSVPEYIVIIPLLLYFCSVNTLFSARIIPQEKKNIIFYILFLIIVITIFCVEALLEGIFTTTFMKWVVNSVT